LLNIGRKLASGSALQFLNLALSALLMLAATPLIINVLGESGWGIFGLLQAAMAVMNLISLGGMEATLYFAAKEGKAGAAAARFLALWHLAVSAIGFLILWGLGSALELGHRLGLPEGEASAFDNALLATACFWVGWFYCNWLYNLCRASMSFKLLAVHQALLSTALPIAGIWAAKQWGGLLPFVWSQAILWGLGSLILAAFILRGLGGGKAKPAEIFSYGRWSFGFGLGVVAMQSADRFFTAPFGATAAAAYTTASAFYQRALSGFGTLPTLLVPAVSRMESKDKKGLARISRAYGLSLRFSSIVILAAFLPLMGFGDLFFLAWLNRGGPDHSAMASGAYRAMLLLGIAGILGSLSMILHGVLLGLGRAKQVAVTSLLGAAFGYILAWKEMPSLGPNAAALCGLAGYALVYLLRLILSEWKVFGRDIWPIAFQHGLLALAALVAFLALRFVAGLLGHPSLIRTLVLMGLASLLLAVCGLAADALISRLNQRESVAEALKRILGFEAA
jgi:O-antigen/teichoic acid export membrane protein